MTFKLSIVAKIITLIMIGVCVSFGIYAIMWGTLLASFVSFWITSYYVEKYLDYSLKELVHDIGAPIFLSTGMVIVVVAISKLQIGNYVGLILQILGGALFYILMSEILKLDQYEYVKNMILRIRK